MGKDILKEIISAKKERLAQAKQAVSLEELKERISAVGPVRSLSRAITRKGQISLIAEIKKASPSAGLIREDFDHRLIAQAYKEVGVQALSVVTEEDYFQGSLRFLTEARQIAPVAVLRKDFIFDPYQVYESRAHEADAILLIADYLSREALMELAQLASELGLECLVEVHTEKQLKKVLKLDFSLIGINNRDLHSLEVDLKTTERLFPLIPRDKTVVVESGITTRKDVLFLKVLGVHALLIGSAFMSEADIGHKVEEVMGW